MPTQVQFRGGTTTEHGSFNGAAREVTVDTTKQTLVVQDGSTNGGFPLLGEDNNDNIKVKFGSSDDLQLWADGSNSYIQHSGDGDLFIQATGADENLWLRAKDDVYIQTNDTENAGKFLKNGAAELYYDSSKKFETLSGGASVTGALDCDSFDCSGSLNVSGNASFHGNLDLHDNDELRIGTGDDLTIKHDSANTYFTNTTGDLVFNSDSIRLRKGDGSEDCLKTIANGAVELYHDNNKKFETHSGGVTVTGELKLGDSSNIHLGADNDLAIYHNNSHGIIKNVTGSLYAATGAFLVQNAAQTENQIISSENGSVDLYYDHARKLATHTNGVLIDGDVAIDDPIYLANTSTKGSRLTLNSTNASSWTGSRELIALDLIGNGADHRTGNLSIKIKKAAADTSPTEMMRIDGTYNKIRIPDSVQLELGDGGDLAIKHDSANTYVTNTTGDLVFNSDSILLRKQDGLEEYLKCTADGAVELTYDGTKKFETTSAGVSFNDGNITNVGSIALDSIKGDADDNTNITFAGNDTVTVNPAGTGRLTVNTSGITVNGVVTCTSVTETSDLSLKSNIEPLTNVLDKINQITGYKYNFTSNNSSSMGVIAQDVEKVFPELVKGEEGSKSLQYSGLIGALIESVKELSAKVTALEKS